MRRTSIKTAIGIFAFACGVVFGQAVEGNLTFEVASVRMAGAQNGPTGTEGGPGSRDPEHFTGRGMPLRLYLCLAYATADCQQQISGPGWIDSEKYDVTVNISAATTKEQYQKMLQNLLTERFKLVLHHETKVLPVYELVVAKDGPKLKESAATPADDAPAPGPPGKVEMDKKGFPVLPPGRAGFISSFGPGALSHWTARQQTMLALARSLSFPTAAGRQVIDKTGLTGKYDFTLEYDMHAAGAPPAADDDPSLIVFDALQKQLGLKLVDAKAPFDFVIVDRGDKTPAEN
jgi:uncharacterized protein (TIGR03435 family)